MKKCLNCKNLIKISLVADSFVVEELLRWKLCCDEPTSFLILSKLTVLVIVQVGRYYSVFILTYETAAKVDFLRDRIINGSAHLIRYYINYDSRKLKLSIKVTMKVSGQ